MKINKLEIKKLIIPSIIILIIFNTIFIFVGQNQLNNYNKIYNYKIESIISQIKEKYPDTDEKEIIETLQNATDSEIGKEYFKRYGYKENENYIEKLREVMTKSLMILILI